MLSAGGIAASGLSVVGRLELTDIKDPNNKIIQGTTQGNSSDYGKEGVAERLTASPATITTIR
jgi:hypothetical protein